MVAALMSGWMAVSCPPRRSCVMPGWHTQKKRARRIAIEPAHPGNHLLWNSSCGRRHLLFTSPYGTVCTPTTVTPNMLLTVNWSLTVTKSLCSEMRIVNMHFVLLSLWITRTNLPSKPVTWSALTKYGKVNFFVEWSLWQAPERKSIKKIPSGHV